MRVPLSFAAQGPDADALLEVSAAGLDNALFEHDGIPGGVFEIDVGVVDFAFEGDVEYASEQSLIDVESILKEGQRDVARGFLGCTGVRGGVV